MKLSRRSFLKALGLGAAAAAVPKIEAKEPEPEIVHAEPIVRHVSVQPSDAYIIQAYATACPTMTMETRWVTVVNGDPYYVEAREARMRIRR